MCDKCKISEKNPNSRAKFSWTSDCKNHKISVQVIISIRIDKSIQTIHLWQLWWHMSMYHSKVVYVFKNGISSWERLTMTALGQFCFAHASIYPPIQFPHLRVYDLELRHYTVILLLVWKDFIQFLQWILYKIIELQRRSYWFLKCVL